MKNYYYFTSLLVLLFLFAACNKEESPEENEDQEIFYTIINNENGGVNTITDGSDTEPWEVAQAIPSEEGGTFSNKLPIILFLNDKILVPSLEDNLYVSENGNKVGGTLNINEGANGYAVLTFTPTVGFNSGSSIVFTLNEGVQDDGGNNFYADNFTLSYTTAANVTGNFDGNGSFENGANGVSFVGDGNILSGAQGCVSPSSGTHLGAITSGNKLVSGDNAIGEASSLMILGPIETDFNSLSFKYNFLSSEFQEYVGSEYDDSVLMTAVGPNGSRTVFLTSVNTVGISGNTECIGFPGLPDDGDSYVGATGWINENIDVSHIGSPAYVIFTVTDVADTIYSSALAIDEVNFN